MPAAAMPTFTVEEVAKHNSEESLWLVIDTAVYDVTEFVDMHPGGAHLLLDDKIAGKDASVKFFSLHRSEVLRKYQRYKIGTITGAVPVYVLPTAGELSTVPHAEPPWLTRGFKSPYYKPSHYAFQAKMRSFFDTHVKAEAQEREETNERPSDELFKLMGSPEWNITTARLGPGKHLHGLVLPGGVKGEEFDYFHELVLIQELVRISAPGYMAGLHAGFVIGAPALINYGGPEIQSQILPELFAGTKFISLAISEPEFGSDVSNLSTRAVKNAEGTHYIVTGQKKWITNGHFSDYFMTGVRTDKGLSMLLIPRDENVETKIIKTAYSHSAGTAQVTFDHVRVPVEYLLGVENEGLAVILSNFNHERWVICARIARNSRTIYEECFIYAHLRMVKGKPLIDLPVIRAKFAKMIAKVDAGQAWVEDITYQMCTMTYAQQSKYLAGKIALLKYALSRAAGEIADDAVQIFGGRGITKGGMGKHVEVFQRTFKFDSLLGGSEEVLADLGVRQAMRSMPRAVL